MAGRRSYPRLGHILRLADFVRPCELPQTRAYGAGVFALWAH
jgi:hypothetical protein